MDKRFIKLALSYLNQFQSLFFINILVVFIAGALEGFGISMLLPILQNVSGQESTVPFIKQLKEIFLFLHIPYTFVTLMIIFGSVMVVKYSFLMLQQHYSRVFSSMVTKLLRNQCIDNLMKISLSDYYNKKVGDLVSTIFTSTQNAGAVSEYFVQLLKGLLFSAVYLAMALMISWQLTGLVCLIVCLSYVAIAPRIKKGNAFGEINKDLVNEIHAVLLDRFSGIQVLKAFNAENDFRERSRKFFDLFQKNEVDIVDNRLYAFIFFEPFLLMVLIALMLTAVEFLKLPIFSFLVLVFIFVQVIPQLKLINSNFMMITDLLPHCLKVHQIISTENNTYLTDGDHKFTYLKEKIEFKDLTFEYNTKCGPILAGINLEIMVNQTVAFVGKSGGGKSTLANMIMRVHDPASGGIFIDGVNLRAMQIDSWKQAISIVDQDAYLFHDSIYNNILMGKMDATFDEVIEAANMANAHEFINKTKDGYQTIIGTRGMVLSGGQKQRIALARALIRKPKILILDEATSALDGYAEGLIQQALEGLQGKLTIVMIAHRLSTVRNADKIFVIEKGAVVEAGTHEALMSSQLGRYKEYVLMQST